MLFADLLRVHTIPLMKILNRIGPSMDLSGTPLVTGFHFDIEPLAVTLEDIAIHPAHLRIYPSNSYLYNVVVRMS